MNNEAILKYVLENGMIDLDTIQAQMDMRRKKELLEAHPYEPWYREDTKKWYVYLPDEEKGRIRRERKTKKEIEDVIVSYQKTKEDNPTIKEVFNEWNDRRLDLGKIKASTHSRNKQIFERHFSSMGRRRIRNVQPEEISDFLEEEIADKNLSAKAFSNLKTITKGFLKRAKKLKIISYNVTELFDELDVSDSTFKKRRKEDNEEVFTEEELPVILNYLMENQNMYTLGLLLIFVTGIRSGELVALKWEDFTGNSIKVGRSETRYKDSNGKMIYQVSEPKTYAGYRTVVIPKDYIWVMEKLRRYNPFTEYIFTDNKGERVHTYSFRTRLQTICDKTNCVRKSPHKIRKTYGSILLDNNIDNRLVIGQMGHTDILCTENHYHRNRRNEITKQQIISSIPEFKAK